MGNPVGSFIWYELLTSDIDGAAAFYKAVVGWTISPQPDPDAEGMDYRMIGRDDGGMAGGAMEITQDMAMGGARPCWLPYLAVDDVDAEVHAIVAAGGRERLPAFDLPVGRIAMVADPQGVPIYLMKPVSPAGQSLSSDGQDPDDAGAVSDVFSATENQHVRWNELASPDQAASMAFYARHFGFTFNEKMSMGDMGDYCFIGHHGQTLGAIMQRQSEQQPAMWLFYFGVPSITAAKSAIEAHGGTVLMGPHEVPGGDWIIVAMDPQGAGFGVVGPKGA
ncbi:VOC family protein [Novosphingobium clariflavum]|uniref:VOC family protein n=1 Tax=Novosphingobium clariflavum TaxID=2029884 RepID=A0ABV6SDD7_9SPHN|nr:VOC family protein [Novosphingobium clariflavum]